MRLYFALSLVIVGLQSYAQNLLVPGGPGVEKKWLKTNICEMKMYALNDGKEQELGILTTKTLLGNEYLIVVNEVKINGVSAAWVDTSIARLAGIAPVRHSSHNMQRDIELKFGESVTGYCLDKQQKKNTAINDMPKGKYFDSNIYPVLLSCLPLTDGYTTDIAIYDYSPDANSGVMKATVKEVSSTIYQTQKSGSRTVWVVKVSDQIGNGRNGVMTYYFDKEDRRLWKQEMNAGGRSLLAKRIE